MTTVQVQCDFCDSTTVEWTYPADDFAMVGLNPDTGDSGQVLGSAGAWAACEPCSALIEANDWDGLADRSVKTHPLVKAGLTTDMLTTLILATRQMHATFRELRKAPRLRFG